MGWSGGTFTRTNGTFSGSTVWAQDRDAGTKITAANHDTHDQDVADGLNNCLAKDGSNAMTGDLDLGTFNVTNATDGFFSGSVGVGTATPSNKLHVIAAAAIAVRVDGDVLLQDSIPVLYFRSEGAVNEWQLVANISDATNDDLIMKNNGTNLFRFGSNGFVSLGHGGQPAAVVHIEGNSNPEMRIRETGANAASLVGLIHLSDTQAEFNAVNGVTNGAVDLDLNPKANGSGQAALRLFRSTNVSGAVQAEFHRGNDTDTIDHLIKSGTSGTLADLCRNGGNVKAGGLLGVGVAPVTVIHGEAAANPTLRLRESGANANSRVDLVHASDASAQLLANNGVTNGAMKFDIDSGANGTGQSDIQLNRNTSTTGAVNVFFCRGNGTLTIDHRLVSGTSGALARFCENGGYATFGGAIRPERYTDATRPTASSLPEGSMIYNTDDNAPNFSDGTNWRDAMGSVT